MLSCLPAGRQVLEHRNIKSKAGRFTKNIFIATYKLTAFSRSHPNLLIIFDYLG